MISDFVRVFSFQSPDILELIEAGEYLADTSVSREQRDYKLDIEQLGGYNPIWGFADYDERLASQDALSNGETFFTMHCEMSAPLDKMKDMICLDLLIPAELLCIGKTHNGCTFAVVFPRIRKEWLNAVYRVEYSDEDFPDWYWPLIVVNKVYREETAMFTQNFKCRKKCKEAPRTELFFTESRRAQSAKQSTE